MSAYHQIGVRLQVSEI